MTDDQTSPELRFRPRARLLQLMGDQLIGSPRLAVFELVKNAYDADATKATVTMSRLGEATAEIEVSDDGDGMSLDTLTNIYLVPGHDHKAIARAAGNRTKKGRLPLGEKGLGRFAVHKLGDFVEVVTRQADGPEHVLTVDWDDVSRTEFLDQYEVSIATRTPETFAGGHGTRVRVRHLRGEPWTKREVRRLARQIASISSPFAERAEEFDALLKLPSQQDWVGDIPDQRTMLGQAPWTFDFTLIDNEFAWEYQFRGVKDVKLAARTLSGSDRGVLLDPNDVPERDQPDDLEKKSRRAVRSTTAYFNGLGPIRGNLSVFDRDSEVWSRIGSESLRLFLDESGGIRVYRDGIRVYNYGEPGDDWLGLDLRRVNSPSKRISNNIVVGVIDLSLESSTGLVEKTNREGFVDDITLERLRALLRGAINAFEVERNKDKRLLRDMLRKDKSSLGGGIEKPLAQIRALAKKHDLADEMDPLVKKAQRAYEDMRGIMLKAGVSGMSLAIVYHEVDHGVRLLHSLLRAGGNPDRAIEQARTLVGVLDSFGDLLRRGEAKLTDLGAVAGRAADLNSVRLTNHDVEVFVELPERDEIVNAVLPMGLVLGAITNLIDNSLYWLSARWRDDASSIGKKRLLIAVDQTTFDEGPAIVIADNGAGFADELSDAVEPFFTRRPDGIGVGLYYVNLIMQSLGGSLRLVGRDEPRYQNFDGAAIALVFPRS